MSRPSECLGRLLSSFALFVPSHVRWKIIAPYIVLTILVAAAGTFIATRFVTGSLEERFDNQLAEAARVASDSILRREREHLSVVRSVAFTVGVPERTKVADTEGLKTLVEPIAANAGIEYLELVGTDGRRILGLRLSDKPTLAYEEIERGPDLSGLALVRDVLVRRRDALGDKFAQLVNLEDATVFYTAGPIRDEAGDLVGAVLVGTSLETMLPSMKFEALADVTLYDLDGHVLDSTFERANENIDLDASRLMHSTGDLPGLQQQRSVFNRDFEFLYGRLQLRGEPVGLFSVALPSSFIASAASTTRWGITVIFAVATMAVIGTGVIIARSVTVPLLKLVRAAQAVADGDLTARSGVDSRDEVGILAQSFDVMTERLARQHLATIRALTSAIDARDPYTAGHSVRVGQLSLEIGRELGLSSRELQHLEVGGYLHDIGKIGIRDNVLLKPGRLTPQEYALIQEHPRIGLDIVQHVELAQEVKDFVIGHHERLDGSGYPHGLDRDSIPTFARIGAVADVYDALTTDRPYRTGLALEDAVSVLKREAKEGQLDESVVEALMRVLPAWDRRLRTDPSLQGFVLPGTEHLERDLGRVGA